MDGRDGFLFCEFRFVETAVFSVLFGIFDTGVVVFLLILADSLNTGIFDRRFSELPISVGRPPVGGCGILVDNCVVTGTGIISGTDFCKC